jgi:predicted RNA-binding protein
MPKIDPIVLGNILVKYQEEIFQLYIISKNDEISERLLNLYEKIGDMILQIESLVA